MASQRLRVSLAVVVLFLLPFLAYAPAWSSGHLLAPGDGTFLHFPLRQASWLMLRHGEWPGWNPASFCGTPLLAGYRSGVLHPLSLAVGLLFPPFTAFQLLILISLGLTGALLFAYMRRLGANVVGAYVAGLSFGLGPYLVGHLGDSATVVAVPSLILVLLWLERFLAEPSATNGLFLSVGIGCLALAGSPEASGAGAIVVLLRVAAGHILGRAPSSRGLGVKLLPILAGLGLAAPQVLPSLLAAGDAGRQLVGIAEPGPAGPSGAAGLVLRYVSHTPAPALAIASLPLMLTHPQVRVLGLALGLCVGLQWGRGPLTAASAFGLLFDMALAILAGLSLSTQWELRRERRGARLRALFLVAALGSAAVLPLSAAAVGPLARGLSSGVGLLALALILYFELASRSRGLVAAAWLVPLTISLGLQPSGRTGWDRLPTRDQLEGKTITRETLARVVGADGREERFFTVTRRWPPEGIDLAFGNLGIPTGLRFANGYDPMVPLRTRTLIDGLNVGGVFAADGLLRHDPGPLEALAVRWIQVPASALAEPVATARKTEGLELPIDPGDRRFFPFDSRPITEVRIVSSLSNAADISQGTAVAWLRVHLVSGRHFDLPLRAGIETAEWAHERPDVHSRIRHRKAVVVETFPSGESTFEGHRYGARLPLPGRYVVSGISARVTASAQVLLSRLTLADGPTHGAWAVTPEAAFVSDPSRFEKVVRTPSVWLFRLSHALPYARVVSRLRRLPDDSTVMRLWREPRSVSAWSPEHEALVVAGETRPAPEGRTGPAEVRGRGGNGVDLVAQGPGVLVVAESWDAGWEARVDGRRQDILRVNHAQIGVVLGEGRHEIDLRYLPRGFRAGWLAAALTVLGMIVILARRQRGLTPRNRPW